MNERLLIVEDELPMRIALQDCLAAEGYRIITAADGEAGLRRAVEEKPDLILLDIMLPRLDGFSLCAELRRLLLVDAGAHADGQGPGRRPRHRP